MDELEPEERELMLQRFFTLSPRQQLAVYRVIRDHLSEGVVETKRDRVVQERAGALEAMKAVSHHLGLDGRAPTPAEFDSAAAELDLDWSRSRVQRAWGRWRFAKEAFAGERLSESWQQRDRRLAHESRRRDRAGYAEALRWWLATKPQSLAARSYGAWARDFNETRGPTHPAVVTTGAIIADKLGMTWRDAVKWARGDIKKENARPVSRRPRERVTRGPYDLISKQDVATMFGTSLIGIAKVVGDPSFPRPVLVLQRNQRLWERSDVEAFMRGDAFPTRRDDEARELYYTRAEVARLCGVREEAVSGARYGIPERAVSVGVIDLWLRAEIDAYLKQRAPAFKPKPATRPRA